MLYFEGVDMKRVEPELKADEMKIVAFSRRKDTQIKRRSDVLSFRERLTGIFLVVSEFFCPCHGKMVDLDTGKPFRVILNYGKNYCRYWKGEDITFQIQDTHTTFIEIHPVFLPLYVFDNSETYHKINRDALNARKLKPKDGGGNTPLLCNVYCKRPYGARMVNVIQT